MFLGELLLDIELDYDEPFSKDLCGTCTVCIDACPTNALTEYQLDTTKCISYLTAEFKQEFNKLQTNNLDGWIYGCDKCQQVCPWNKKSQTMSNEKLFQPIEEIHNYSIEDWCSIDENEFRSIFKNSPAKRIKHYRFVRNVKAVKESSNNVE
jgi:epoxyqueuosine reductase